MSTYVVGTICDSGFEKEKHQEYPSVVWAHNALQRTQNSEQIKSYPKSTLGLDTSLRGKNSHVYPDSKIRGANMGPTLGL